MVSETLKQFVLAGTLLLGTEIGLQSIKPYENPENYSLAEVLEMIDEEDREIFLKMTENLIKKPVSVESSIPFKGAEIKVSEIKKYLATLPKGWTTGEIESIRTTTEKDDSEEIMPSGALAVFHGDSGKVFFDQDLAKIQERGFNVHVISHEVAHGNDFFTDANITWKERYSLYKKLKDRVMSEDKFVTYYLVSLEKKFNEGGYGWLSLMREYWAEICAQYMSDPTQLHVDDFKLVHEFVIKNDPNYKWREKLGDRAKIQGEFSSPHIPKSE